MFNSFAIAGGSGASADFLCADTLVMDTADSIGAGAVAELAAQPPPLPMHSPAV